MTATEHLEAALLLDRLVLGGASVIHLRSLHLHRQAPNATSGEGSSKESCLA